MNDDEGLAYAECRRYIECRVGRYAKTSHDREYLAQDVWCALSRVVEAKGPPRDLQALTTRVCRSVCMDYLRRRYRKDQAGEVPLVAEPYYSDPPVEKMIQKERLKAALGRLLDLPRLCQRAFDLVVLRGMDSTQVGRLLGETPSTVRTWIMRTRQILAEAVE